MSSYKDFKVLLFQLAEKLSEHDLEGIRSIEDLPAEFEGQSALKILLKLEMLGRISASNSTTLEEVFKNINRMDLVKRVKDFFKSRKCKKNTLRTAEESHLSLVANLEVTLMQMRLLQDQLLHLQKTLAETTGSRSMNATISEAVEDAEQLGKKLLDAKEQHVKDEESSESDSNLTSPVPYRGNNPLNLELQQQLAQFSMKKAQPKSPTKENDMPPAAPAPRLPAPTPFSEEESDVEQYAELTPRPFRRKEIKDSLYYDSANLLTEENSALVTGALASPKSRRKPIPAPKPRFIGPKESTKQADTEDNDQSASTGTTGDSGFADPAPFLKVSLEAPSTTKSVPVSSEEESLTSASYYKSIHREEVGSVSYYKLTNRETQTKRLQDVMESDPTQQKDEGIYENYSTPNSTS